MLREGDRHLSVALWTCVGKALPVRLCRRVNNDNRAAVTVHCVLRVALCAAVRSKIAYPTLWLVQLPSSVSIEVSTQPLLLNNICFELAQYDPCVISPIRLDVSSYALSLRMCRKSVPCGVEPPSGVQLAQRRESQRGVQWEHFLLCVNSASGLCLRLVLHGGRSPPPTSQGSPCHHTKKTQQRCCHRHRHRHPQQQCIQSRTQLNVSTQSTPQNKIT